MKRRYRQFERWSLFMSRIWWPWVGVAALAGGPLSLAAAKLSGVVGAVWLVASIVVPAVTSVTLYRRRKPRRRR